jgi:hypothetical protein
MHDLTLENLSNEVLNKIFLCVDHNHKPTLKALALVNKHFHALACPFLFSTLRLFVQDQDQVSSIVQTFPVRVIENTRHLIIERLPREKIYPYYLYSPLDEVHDSFFHSARQNWETIEHPGWGPFLIGFADDIKWKPLATSISQMHALRDLTYNCNYQLSPCILETIHQSQPQCRLHINTFYLRCLNGPIQFNPVLDLENHELALATSPCLYSITAAITGLADYNYNAIKELSAGLAPNLKKIHTFPAQTYAEITEEYSEKQTWQGFKLDNELESKKTQVRQHRPLSSLILGYGDVEDWHSFTTFSYIRYFELDEFTSDQLRYMTTCSFASLETLILNLGNSHPAYDHDPHDLDIPTGDFLVSIPPLKSLKITGAAGPITFNAILEHHGSSLKRLHFVPKQRKKQFVLNLECIKELKDSLPLLEELTIKVPRSQGDKTEVAIYRALGSIRKLHTLYLLLDASIYAAASSEDADYGPEDADYENQVPNDASFDDTDREIMPITLPNFVGLRKGFARKAFINCALDETLVSSIFNTISAAKPSSGALPLESLSIWITAPFQFDDGYAFDLDPFMRLVDHISRSWIVERNPRDDSRHQLVLTDTTTPKLNNTYPFTGTLSKECFIGLWPGDNSSESGDEDWRNHWHSFPLCDL